MCPFLEKCLIVNSLYVCMVHQRCTAEVQEDKIIRFVIRFESVLTANTRRH